MFSRLRHTGNTTVSPWGKLLHEKVEPMLKPEPHHQEIVPRGSGYAAKRIGWGEAETP